MNWSNLFQNILQHFAIRRVPKYVSAYLQYKDKLRDNPLRVFISYDWDDEVKVRLLYERLRSQVGIAPWLDKESNIKDIPHESVAIWKPKLMAELKKSDCVIICHSNESINNKGVFRTEEVPFILKEAKKERELSTYVILAMLEICVIPPAYKSWPTAHLYLEQEYELMLDKIVINAYEELKHKRGVKYEEPLSF
jgi:hypothetical protein